MHARPPLPQFTSDVDAPWVTAALRHSGVIHDARVVALEGERIGTGVGLLGELTRLMLTYDKAEAGAPKTVILKIPTADPATRGIAQMLGFYEKETRFYRDLRGDVPLTTARCFYTDMEPAQIKYVLLLEDLGGLRLGDQLAGTTAEEAREVVIDLAKLHAAFWQSPKLDALDWIPGPTSPLVQPVHGAFLMAQQPFLANFGSALNDYQRALLPALGAKMLAALKWAESRPMTVVHADPRLDNIVFGRLDGSPGITWLDWQLLLKSTGLFDIGYFLSQSLDPALRREIEVPLLREYLAALEAGGVTGYIWDELWDDYRGTVLFALAYPVIGGGTVDLANERAIELAKAMALRSATAVEDLAAHELLDRFE